MLEYALEVSERRIEELLRRYTPYRLREVPPTSCVRL